MNYIHDPEVFHDMFISVELSNQFWDCKYSAIVGFIATISFYLTDIT